MTAFSSNGNPLATQVVLGLTEPVYVISCGLSSGGVLELWALDNGSKSVESVDAAMTVIGEALHASEEITTGSINIIKYTGSGGVGYYSDGE